MPRFVRVEMYPPEGFPNRLWGPTPENPGIPLHDAFLRAARPVVELYSEALDRVGLDGPRAELVLFVTEPVSTREEVTVEVWRRPRDLMPETGFVGLSRSVGRLGPAGRARVALEVVDTAARTLAAARGWDASVLDACRAHVMHRHHRYEWTGPWKSSPDRRRQARARYRIAEPDGLARVRLELRRRGDDDAVATSPPALAASTSVRLRRSAATLAWDGSRHVGVVPFWGQGPQAQGLLAARLDGQDEWTFAVRDDVRARAPGGDGIDEDPDAPVPEVVAELT
jgi:hypothetical protein